nr:DsrE family protein [Novosphingobium terrae]
MLNETAHQARFKARNPNLPLIEALERAGVEVRWYNYALAHQGFRKGEVAPGVKVDLSAMMTLANLQMRGWAVIAD